MHADHDPHHAAPVVILPPCEPSCPRHALLVGWLVLLLVTACGTAPAPTLTGTLVVTADPVAQIYIIPLDTGTPHRLTAQPTVTHAFPAWSPDCTRLVFVADQAGNEDIYVMAADGSERHQLTTDPARDTNPEWSPDGRQIAFESSRGHVRMIYLMNTDGTGQTVLTDQDGATWSPTWSPDSTQLAFLSETGIYIIGRDGQHARLVTAFPAGAPSPAEPARGLVWSPDGRHLLFSSQRDYREHLYVVQVDGTKLRQLTDPGRARVDTHPVWSPDGASIAFASNRGQEVRLWVLPTDGDEPTVLHQELDGYGAVDWCR